MGRIITEAERGNRIETETPEYASVGSNTLNEFTLLRATKALYDYLQKWMSGEGLLEQPRLVIAHDVRHFSPKFSQLVASAWQNMGGFAMTFEGPRSTPQLSFTVRNRYAHAGVVITASHNPFHDNGFKAYFHDGAQLVSPHDKGVVDHYQKISFSQIAPWLQDDILMDNRAVSLSTSDDMAYKGALEDAVLNPDLLKSISPKIVFTPIHGTGAISSVPALWDHGVQVVLVDGQSNHDPNFTSVSSPNPENAEALSMGIALAKKMKAPYIMGSDPDCDRIGVAVLEQKGDYKCLSGNQVACLLAEYRLQALKNFQIIKEGREQGFALLKTFVTTPMLDKIAKAFGVRCINTPTGFKWMAKKLKNYEEKAYIRIQEEEGIGLDFDNTSLFTRMDILSKYSTCAVLSAEESYGYLPLDIVRDKDGNASALAIAEAFAYIESLGSTPLNFLDGLYQKYGYHLEKTENIYYEGAQGNATIKRLIESYRTDPITEILDLKVESTKDYTEPVYVDEDEEPIVTQNFLQLFLDNHFRIDIRPSGTEPKIKYYLFGCGEAKPVNLDASKKEVHEMLDKVAKWILTDAEERSK